MAPSGIGRSRASGRVACTRLLRIGRIGCRYFFAMKFSSDSYRFVMPTSADDRRPFRQEAAAPDRIEEKDLSRKKSVLWIGVTMGLLLTGSSLALAQSAAQPAQDGMLKSGPPVWDANGDGVFTCDEWKSFADRIFTSADRNRDGRLDPSEFTTVQRADTMLADSDFGYFDENQDGKITRREFVEKPNAFILRFDANGDCRVTADEIRAANAPKGPKGPAERPRDRFH
jgi:Ca2+-binding EF-hand superfamily protein